MASSFNAKCVHRDGKSELKIGIDESAKIIKATEDVILFKNSDGTMARIDPTNIIGMPENVSETNKLITQNDLKAMMKEINEIISSAKALASIVGGLEDSDE